VAGWRLPRFARPRHRARNVSWPATAIVIGAISCLVCVCCSGGPVQCGAQCIGSGVSVFRSGKILRASVDGVVRLGPRDDVDGVRSAVLSTLKSVFCLCISPCDGQLRPVSAALDLSWLVVCPFLYVFTSRGCCPGGSGPLVVLVLYVCVVPGVLGGIPLGPDLGLGCSPL